MATRESRSSKARPKTQSETVLDRRRPEGRTTNPMRVVMVDSMVGNDYSFCLCASLKSAGMDVSLVVTEDRSENTRVPLDFALRKWSPSKQQNQGKFAKAIKYFRYLLKLGADFLTNRPDIVHFQFFRRERIETLFFLVMRLFGINLVYTAHDVLPPEKKRVDFFFKYLTYKAAKRIIVHTNFLKEMLVNTFGVAAEKVKIAPHGNFDNYLPEHEISKAEARRRLGLEASNRVLLFFGIIRPYKGVGLLLDAFEKAVSENNNLRLAIAGSALSEDLKEKYARKIAGLFAKDRVLYHAEFVPNEKVAEYFTAADAVVLPYRNIYHSGVLHLAYSFGRPVIATKVGDFPETVEHEKSGYLVEKDDLDGLAGIFLQAFSEPQKLAAMGEYARAHSEKKYSWENVARETKEVYAALVKTV
jgi:glycosyltransferase involved in cell wall biosynthesis